MGHWRLPGLRGLAGHRGVQDTRGARGLPCWLFRTRENRRGRGRERRMLSAGECRGDSKFRRGLQWSGGRPLIRHGGERGGGMFCCIGRIFGGAGGGGGWGREKPEEW